MSGIKTILLLFLFFAFNVLPLKSFANEAPVADAGKNFVAMAKTKVTLDGSSSYDSDGEIVGYQWIQIKGPSVELAVSGDSTRTFIAPEVVENTKLVFRLTVIDNDGARRRAYIRVVVKPAANVWPIADAGDNQKVEMQQTVLLDGSGSYDPDGEIIHYEWSQKRGPSVQINDADKAQATFTAPMVSLNTRLVFRLIVTDNRGKRKAAFVQIIVKPVSEPPPPVQDSKSKLNDTGITSCSDGASNNLACPVTAYPGQDAEYGRDKTSNSDQNGLAGFSFSKLDAAGGKLSSSATNWDCIQDEVAGLVWESKKDDGGLHDKDWTYSWYDADKNRSRGVAGLQNGGNCGRTSGCDTNAYVQAVNDEKLCGFTNWRIPKPNELRSIVDYGRYSPAIDTDYFPNTPPNGVYWSSLSSAFGTYTGSYAWFVYFKDGDDGWAGKNYAYSVRLVSDGE